MMGMTRAELEAQIRTLPEGEQAALLDDLLRDLPDSMRSALIARLVAQRSPEELAVLRARFESEVAEGFASGEGREWTDADWRRLESGDYRYPPTADSWATPPGWKSPRLDKDP